MLKNRTTQIVIGVVVILILAGGYFLFLNKSSTESNAEQNQSIDTGPQNISPDEIDLEMTASPDKKKVQFTIGKLTDIKALAYELTYEAESTEQERSEGAEERIPRGITGDAKFSRSESKYQSPWLDLGSCSKNVCRYDKGIESINLILKITKENNKIYATEKELDL